MEIKQEQIIPEQNSPYNLPYIFPPFENRQLSKCRHAISSNDAAYQHDQSENSGSRETMKRASYRDGNFSQSVDLICRVLDSEDHQKVSGLLSTKKALVKAKPCNETKNIAKNYGKAIIAFIQNNRHLFRKICKACSTPYQRVTQELPELKAMLSTVTGFRKVWTEYRYASCMRRVSNHFLRKMALGYIFNSKIDNYRSHIKYRGKFLESLQDPQNFDHLKDY